MRPVRALAAVPALLLLAACPELILGPPEGAASDGGDPGGGQDGGPASSDGGQSDAGTDGGSPPITFGTMLLAPGQGQVNQPLYAVHGTAADDVWAVGHLGHVLHFDGAQWQEIFKDSDDLYGVFAEAGGAIVVGRWGRLLTCVPTGGCTGTSLAGTWDLFSVARGSDGRLWAAGTTGIYLLTQNGGTWSATLVFTTVMPVNSLVALPGLELFAVGAPSGTNSLRVAHFQTSTWTAEATDAASGQGQLNGVWSSPDGFLLAVGDKGETARRDPAGPWTPTRPGETFSWLSVSGDAPDRAYAVGNGPWMGHWGGAAWSKIDPPVVQPFYSIWAGRDRSSGRAVYFAVGGSGNTVILQGQ